MDADNQEKRYLEERAIYIELQKNSSNLLDKYLLAIGMGALLLSVTFIEKIVPQPQAWTLYILLFSWVLLIASVLLTLISFYTSEKAIRKTIEILDLEYGAEAGDKIDDNNKYSKITERLNFFSIASLILGIVLLTVFSFLNIKYKVNIENEKSNHKGGIKMSEKLNEGFVPPKTSNTSKGGVMEVPLGFVPPKPAAKPPAQPPASSSNQPPKK